MDAAFAWLNAVMGWVGQFVPQRVIVPTTHGAIKWVNGDTVVVLAAGAYWYWPYTTLLQLYPTARQATDLPTQTMVTTDGKTFVLGALLVYEIRDLAHIAAHTFDSDQTIRDIAQGAIHAVCSGCSWVELHDANLPRLLTREVRRRLRPYGVRVLRTTLTSLAPARVIKLFQSTAAEGT